MEFRLLGPVEVVLDDEPVGIAAARQEIVLTMLLLEANRVVSVSRLVDALWDEEPPLTAKSQVQISVSALRRLLARPDDSSVITTRSPGYLIRVPDEALDLRRFELLAARGASFAAEQQNAEAVQQHRAALGLWRGPAAMGVESRVVQSAAVRLNESRLAVLENCLDLELQLGRHQELVGELRELIAKYPLRERFRAQLMIALYRSGRQAEGLEVFRTARDTLMEELGLEPGDELRTLERAILANDPELDLPEGGGRVTMHGVTVHGGLTVVPTPRQLPAAIADFTGREDLLAQVCELLSPASQWDGSRHVPVVTLTGRGGVGKTALALYAAHLLRDAYPDGQLFTQLNEGEGQPKSTAGLLERFLRSFGVAPTALPAGVEERAVMYRSWLAERRVLIVFDGAVSTKRVLPLLPGSPSCAVIITSRNRLSGLAGAHRFDIEPLDEQSGLDLLSRAIGVDRVAAEEESARALVGLCERLPLALRIAAAKLAARPHWRVRQMVRRLEDEKRRLDELDLDGVSIRATLSLSYDNLDEDGRRLLRRLSLLGSIDFASWVSAPLLELDVDASDELLDVLVEARLVEAWRTEDGSVRFQLHDLVRIYAVERLMGEESAGAREALLHRLLGCWLALATEAHRRGYGGDFSILHGTAEHWPLPPHVVDALLENPIGWFQSEHSALVAAIMQACQAGFDELGWDLALTSVTLFETGSHVDEWRATHEAALATVRAADNSRGEAALLYSLGTLALTGHLNNASHYLNESLRLFDELDDCHGRALALGCLAFVDRLDGDYTRALTRHRDALDGFRQVGDLISEAHMLKSMAQIHMDWQQYDVAEQMLDEALAVCRKLGAARVTAQTEHELAELCLRRGDLPRAVESFDRVRLSAREADDIVGQAYAALGLGVARCMLGEHLPAEADLRTAQELVGQTGDLLLQGRTLFALAELEFANGRIPAATANADEALRVLGNLGSAMVWRARVLELAGRLHERSGRVTAAAEAWRRALEWVGEADPALVRRLNTAVARLGGDPAKARRS
jgi:DNA-binding SARP family transcriptional activator